MCGNILTSKSRAVQFGRVDVSVLRPPKPVGRPFQVELGFAMCENSFNMIQRSSSVGDWVGGVAVPGEESNSDEGASS